MTEDPVIRAATAADIPAVHRLLGELASFVGEPDAYLGTEAALRRYGFGPDRVFHSLLALQQDCPVALANYFPDYSTWRGTPGVYVLDLYVTEAQRGTGLGRRMLAQTLERAADAWGARYARLSVHGHNDAAIRFYRNLGFSMLTHDCLMAAPVDAVLG